MLGSKKNGGAIHRFLFLSAVLILFVSLESAPALAAMFSRVDLGYSASLDARDEGEVTLKFAPGLRFSGTLGWTMPARLAIEFELGVILNRIENKDRWSVARIPLFANVAWFPSYGRLSPFVGVGAGGILNSFTVGGCELHDIVLPSGEVLRAPEGGVCEQSYGVVPGYHGFAGLSWAITPRVGMHVSYDYQRAGGNFNASYFSNGRVGDISSQSLSIGVDLHK